MPLWQVLPGFFAKLSRLTLLRRFLAGKRRDRLLARVLLNASVMKTERIARSDEEDHAARPRAGETGTVLIIGGSGGMSDRYRDVVAQRGFSLRHFENRVPPGARRSLGKIALVVVMAGMVSHALRDQALRLADGGARVVYLRTASVSALRAAVDQQA